VGSEGVIRDRAGSFSAARAAMTAAAFIAALIAALLADRSVQRGGKSEVATASAGKAA